MYPCYLYFLKTGQEFGADDFLPALSYVMVLCNMPEISLEVEYMMELLESSWLTGEGMDKYLANYYYLFVLLLLIIDIIVLKGGTI